MSDLLNKIAWPIAVEMELHASLRTTTKAKAEAINDHLSGLLTLDQANAMVGAALQEAGDVAKRYHVAAYKRCTDAEDRGDVAKDTDEECASTAGSIHAAITRDIAPDATAALDRALERMRERCAKIAWPAQMHRKGRVGIWRLRLMDLSDKMRALALHEEPKPVNEAQAKALAAMHRHTQEDR